MISWSSWLFPFERGDVVKSAWALFDGTMACRLDWEVVSSIDGNVHVVRYPGDGEYQFRFDRKELFEALTRLAVDETKPESIRNHARRWITPRPEEPKPDPDSDEWYNR